MTTALLLYAYISPLHKQFRKKKTEIKLLKLLPTDFSFCVFSSPRFNHIYFASHYSTPENWHLNYVIAAPRIYILRTSWLVVFPSRIEANWLEEKTLLVQRVQNK